MKRKFTFLMAAFTLLAFLVIPMGVKGQAQVGDTLWAETWTDGTVGEKPSEYGFEGTIVYAGSTLEYSESSTSTKLYDDELAGGATPELLLSKNNTTWTVSGIPTGSAIELTLTFKANYDRTGVTTTTTGITVGTKSFSNGTVTYPITVASNVTTFELVFTNTTSSNVRIDNVLLKVTTSSSTDPYITAEDVTLDWDATSGEIDYTLNNAVTGGLLTAAATSGEWISNVAVDTENSKVTFTTTANPDGEREGTITITYTYNTNQTVTKEVAVTQQTRPSYTVTYVANGGTGTMTDPNSPYYSNADVTLLDNSFTAPEGQMWSAWVVTDGAGESITVTNGHFTMPESNVTVTPQWVNDPSAPTYEWVLTALADLTTSDVFVIVGTVSNSSYSMSNNSTSNPAAVAVTISNDKIISTVADSIKWNISGNATNGYTFYPNGSTTTWLYCNTTASSGSNTNLRVGGGNNATRKLFVPEGTTLKTKDSNTARFWNVYSGGPDWRGYTSNSTSTTVTFYKRQIASTDPNITASDVEIAYDATSGSIEYTINNPAGGTLSASVDNATCTIAEFELDAVGETSVSFSCLANEETTARTATVTLTYTYGEESVTKDVTVTQAAAPLIYTTIPALFEAATSTATNVTVTFDNWVVTAVSTNGKNVFVTDGTNGFVIYSSTSMSSTYAVGNILSGTIECSLKLQNGYAQLTNVNAENLTIATGGTVTVANIALADLAGVNTGALVSYENLTCSVDASGNTTKYYLSDGTTTVQIYSSLYAFGTTLQDGHIYNITGIYQQYNTNSANTKEILPRSADDIMEVASPTITVDDITTGFDGESYTEDAFEYSNLEVTSSDDFGIQFYNEQGGQINCPSWVLLELGDLYVYENKNYCDFYYTISKNQGTNSRTTYFKIYSGTVYSNLATITQAGAPHITLTPNTITVDASEHDGTLETTFVNMGENPVVSEWYVAFYETLEDVEDDNVLYEWDEWVTCTVNANNQIEYEIAANETDEARTVYFRASCLNSAYGYVNSDVVTVTQAAPEAPFEPATYTLANSIVSGQTYIIVGRNGDDYAMGVQASNNRSAAGISINGTTATVLTEDVYEFVITALDEPGFYSIYDARYPGYLYAASSSSNYLRTESELDANHNGDWGITIDAETGVVNIVASNSSYSRNVMQYNSSSGLFSCYASASQKPVYLYVKSNEPYITVAPTEVNVDAEDHDGNLTMTYLNMGDNPEFDVLYYEADGVTGVEAYDWFVASVNSTNDTVFYMIEANDGEERTAYFKVYGLDDEANDVYSELVTITQEAYVPTTTYTLATTIENGRRYIIVGRNSKDYAMGEQAVNNNGTQGNNRLAVEISINGNVASVPEGSEVHEFVINGPDINGRYTIYDPVYDPLHSPVGLEPGYLYAASSSANHLKTQDFNDANGLWSISIDEESGVASVTAQGSNTRNKMRYNNVSHIFSCYASGQQDIYLYIKNEDEPSYEFVKDIAGYVYDGGGYNLIASPIVSENVFPGQVEGLITDGGFNPEYYSYDFYRFDFTEEQEWRNFRNQTFWMYNGEGYLYANMSNTTLRFGGTPREGTEKEIDLLYDDENDYNFNGWNLIGNPFTFVATIDWEDFYVMNDEGTNLMLSEREYINPMEGIFVKATQTGESVTFSEYDGMGSATPEPWGDVLNLRVSGNNSRDVARIRFGEGRSLEKLSLNPINTKLYFTQGNQDFAVVRSANEGEMPVNFKAETNGNYTISVNAENVEMNYLHLIDNLTGADVDLLATPSYSFEANTNDYATRFRLVFKANANVHENADADADTFAFFNGNEWVVSNIGEATLQVVDVMGRVLSSETINGNAEISIKQEPGVYMLRLINGENVKVQKVVVK